MERLEEQVQQQTGTIQELRNKIEILSQPVYHQLPAQYIYPVPTDPGQYLGQPGGQDLGQLLQLQPGDPHQDGATSTASGVNSLPTSEDVVAELLNSTHSLLATPPTPKIESSPRREVTARAKESVKGRLPVKDSLESPPEPEYSPDRRQRRSGGASRTPRKSSPAYCPPGVERAQSVES